MLLKIDPAPYQFVVDQRRAALAEAEQSIPQLKSALDAALGKIAGITAEHDRARNQSKRYAEANRRAGAGATPFSVQQVENQRQLALAKEGELASAVATAEQAQLTDAERDLACTVVRAPTDVIVPIVPLRAGVRVVPLPLRLVLAFVPVGHTTFAAAFVQNAMQRVKTHCATEVAFDAVPGRAFEGKVRRIIEAMVQSEIQAGGTLIDPAAQSAPGRVLVEIVIEGDLSAYQLPPGSSGQVAVYTEHAELLAILRKVLLRMKSWKNFLFFEGH